MSKIIYNCLKVRNYSIYSNSNNSGINIFSSETALYFYLFNEFIYFFSLPCFSFSTSHVNQIKITYLEAILPSSYGKASLAYILNFFLLCVWPTAQSLWCLICLTHDSYGTFPFIWVRKQKPLSQPDVTCYCYGSNTTRNRKLLLVSFPGIDVIKQFLWIFSFFLKCPSLNSRSYLTFRT